MTRAATQKLVTIDARLLLFPNSGQIGSIQKNASTYSFLALLFQILKSLSIIENLGTKVLDTLSSLLLLGGIQLFLSYLGVVIYCSREGG